MNIKIIFRSSKKPLSFKILARLFLRLKLVTTLQV